MDILYSSSCFSAFLLLILFFSLWLLKQYCKKSITQKQPPGPIKLPIVGNWYNEAFSLGHRSLRNLSMKYGPLIHLTLGEISVLVVSSSMMAKEVMKTHDLSFVHRPELVMSFGRKDKDISFSPYGDYWRQMRKICTLELLSAKRVQSFSFIREDEVNKLIESIQYSCAASGSLLINLSRKVYFMTSSITTRALFGKECENHERFIELTKKIVQISKGFDLADLFPSVKFIDSVSGMRPALDKIRKEGNKILEIIINEHQEKQIKMGAKRENDEAGVHQEDLVDVLLRLQQSDDLEAPITIENIKALIWEMYGGGTDLSSIAVEWAMSELMRNPRAREKAQAEIREALEGQKIIKETDLEKLHYLKSVIKETLRLHPPIPILIPRECRESCTINGYDIPKNTKVIVNAWAIGRDPSYWDNAECFVPERFDLSPLNFRVASFEYIPFGAGRRMCPGILYGLANIELALAQLLYHFNWELPNGMKPMDLDMIEANSATVGRKNQLCLIATPYK
ncbi:Cytochrome P450 [Quillaja saponaria]|uniref:Cytochrome P450 n=1 Tax=Quillaja saponaria TaxID=32244 RepID=A0AAD7PBD3_QUISA|nr:Cytochrome P450 [Quillaja saponaria]